MKQTSIEWLANQILDNWNDITAGARNIDEFIQQAKEMHKQEIVQTWEDGDYAYFYSKKTGKDFENGADYYNEIYGGNK